MYLYHCVIFSYIEIIGKENYLNIVKWGKDFIRVDTNPIQIMQ